MTKSNPAAAARAWLDVDLAALVRNARQFQRLAKAPLLPMLKANGYGLGAVPVARALEPLAPWGFGVATVAEGAELRASGIGRPIVVFTPMLPDRGSVTAVREYGLRPVIGDLAGLAAWTASGGGPFHLEIDTGLSRAGFLWHDEATLRELRDRLAATGDCEGVFTHFHSADSNAESARTQLERFHSVRRDLLTRRTLMHYANSAAAGLDPAGGDLARPGIYLYGGRAGSLVPEAVARLCARVVALRRLRPGDTVSYGAERTIEQETVVATLAIGYGDGVPRSLGNRGRVELGERIVPMLGRVTMDMLMVELGAAAVELGDSATIFGGRISLDQQAEQAGTISYELLTAVAPRVTRRYLKA